MEFLDINLTKDSSLLLHAIRETSILADFKSYSTLVLKLHTKKSRNKKTLVYL
jgi:hypothetical protein